MEELIKIKETDKGKAVSARELYNFLGYDSSQWARWYQKNIIDNEFALENIDYQILRHNVENQSAGRPTKDFALSLDFGKKLSMMARTEKGEQARSYFIDCEKKALNPYTNMSKLEALKIAVEAEEEKEKYKALAQKNQTRANYLNHILASDEKMDIGQVAKILEIQNLGRNKFYKKLREIGVFFKNKNEPKQHYINQGLFEVKEKWVPRPGYTDKLTLKVLVTQKGLAWLAKKMGVVVPEKTLMKIN